MTRTITLWVAGVLLGLLYAYAVVAAFGNFTGMLGLSGALGTGLSASGWAWLMTGLLLPVLICAAAVIFGRTAGMRVLLLAAGLALLGAVQIDIMHLIPESTYFA